MSAPLAQALERLTAAGITLTANGDRLGVAYQTEPTEAQWSWLARNKAALLEALRAVPTASVCSTPTSPTPTASVCSTPASPTSPETLTPEERAAAQELIEERAAIQEHDGGLARHQAETEARAAIRVYFYRLSDRPQSWLTVIAPGRDLDQARDDLQRKFPGRMLEIVEYQPRRAADKEGGR